MIAEVIKPRHSTPTKPRSKTSSKGLWKRYTSDDYGTELENDLVHKHLPLVKSVVGRIAINLPPHVPREDLHSVGMMGLLQAIRNYDPTNAASLESYARHRIRGAVLDELRRIDWVPRSVHDKSKVVQRAIAELEQSLGRIPEGHEVAKHMGIPLPEYETLIEKIKPATFVSLDSAGRQDGENDEPFAIPDDAARDPMDEAAKKEMVRIIATKLDALPDNMRKVLSFYYYENMRLREIAEIFGVTESRICQIHSQAILSLRALVKGL